MCSKVIQLYIYMCIYICIFFFRFLFIIGYYIELWLFFFVLDFFPKETAVRYQLYLIL